MSIANDRFHIGREKAKELGSKEEEEDNDDDEFAGTLPGLHGGYNHRYPASHQQPHYGNSNAYVSATSHMPNFAFPSTANVPPETSGGFAIPGLDSSARPPVPAGIPGLAAAQALAASYNQQYAAQGRGAGGNRFDDRVGGEMKYGVDRRQGRQQGGHYQNNNGAGAASRFRPY